MIKSLQITFVFLSLLASCKSQNKTNSLRNKIEQIVSDKKAIVGVSIIGSNGQDTITLNGDRHCPLQSVFKLHISIAVLAEIDKGKLSLDQEIAISKDELLPESFYSPLRDENPNGGTFTIAKLIQYSISQSDNVACDVLIRLIGTPKTVEDYFKKKEIKDIEITFNEENMQAEWENMFQNWTTPSAATETLKLFYNNKGKILSQESYDFLWQTMKETTTGSGRIKGLLPTGTIVAHKTGTSGTNEEGLTPATNDIGIVFLPNGQYFIISIFVTDSMESEKTNEKLIAEISKAAYDHYKNSLE